MLVRGGIRTVVAERDQLDTLVRLEGRGRCGGG